MKMGLFKHRVLPLSIVSILLSSLSSSLLCVGISNFRDAYNETSVYENTQIDFMIPSPSKEQVENFKNEPFVSGILPYYYTKANATCNEKEQTNNILFFDTFSNMGLSPYNEKRCIDSSAFDESSMYVDYAFFARTKCKLGDEATFVLNGQTLKFVIAGIFEENTLFDGGAIAVQYNKTVENAVMKNRTKALPYSGAYLSSPNKEECKNYLYANYKPMGLLRERDEFDSDEAYSIYLAGFDSTDYSSEIVTAHLDSADHYLKSDSLRKNGYTVAIIGYVIPFLFSIVATLIMDARKNESAKVKQLVKNGEDKKSVVKYYAVPHVVSFGLSLTVSSAIIVANRLCSSSYIRTFPFAALVTIEAAVVLLCFDVNILLSLKKANSFFGKKR